MEKLDGVRAFRNDLTTYRYHQKKLEEYEFKYEDIYDKLGGYHSPSLSSVGGGQMSKDTEYALRDKAEKFLSLMNREKEFVRNIEEILERMPEEQRIAALRIYADGETVARVSMDYHLSEHGLRYRINKAIYESLMSI